LNGIQVLLNRVYNWKKCFLNYIFGNPILSHQEKWSILKLDFYFLNFRVDCSFNSTHIFLPQKVFSILKKMVILVY